MNITPFDVRLATNSDALNLVMLKTQVWLHTYATEGVRNEFSNYIISTFTKENMLKSIQNRHMNILVAEQNEHLVACAEIDYKAKCPENCGEAPELTVLYVSEHFTNKGVGFSLLKECESLVCQNGFDGLWLTVYYQNKRAIDFYKHQGFK